MAKAHKCDRCGKYYDDLPVKQFEEIIDGRTIKYSLDIRAIYVFHGPEDIDLCPECLDKIHSYLNMSKEV